MPDHNRPHTGGSRLLIGIIVLAVIFGGLLARKYLNRQPLPPPAPGQSAPLEGERAATLFFAAPDGTGLIRESRLIESCDGIESCAEELLDELINGPLGDLAHTLPETTMYHGVSLAGDVLTVDFGQELPDGMAPGSAAEMAAVYSVVDTLAVNFPQVKRVRLLVEGKPLDTLKGHVDLREPLAPDFTLENSTIIPAPVPETQRSPR